MDIIKRNFFKLIRNGAFGENNNIEPMSNYKWKVLDKMAQRHGVELVIKKAKGSEELFGDILRVPDAGLSHMANSILNRRLQKIRDNEPTSPEASIETLNMLDIMVQTTEHLISQGLVLAYIIKMGMFLRMYGDRIDYVKLENWLHRLGISKMAEIEGSILIYMFGFEKDEIPFVYRQIQFAYKLTMQTLAKPAQTDTDDWKFTQNDTIFVENNSKAMIETIKNCMRYVPFAPIEAVSCFIQRFTRSISNLEE